jgi:hypothetical protein
MYWSHFIHLSIKSTVAEILTSNNLPGAPENVDSQNLYLSICFNKVMTLPQQPETIHDLINGLRQEQEKQESQALDAIRAIFQNPSEYQIHLPEPRSAGSISRGPGAIAKFSRYGGKFLGWYREGQRSGKPNAKLPIEADLDAQHEAYYAMLRAAIPTKALSLQLGKRSGIARHANGLIPQILMMYRVLESQKIPRRHRAKLIARQLGCNTEYVRRILRLHKSPGIKR